MTTLQPDGACFNMMASHVECAIVYWACTSLDGKRGVLYVCTVCRQQCWSRLGCCLTFHVWLALNRLPRLQVTVWLGMCSFLQKIST